MKKQILAFAALSIASSMAFAGTQSVCGFVSVPSANADLEDRVYEMKMDCSGNFFTQSTEGAKNKKIVDPMDFDSRGWFLKGKTTKAAEAMTVTQGMKTLAFNAEVTSGPTQRGHFTKAKNRAVHAAGSRWARPYVCMQLQTKKHPCMMEVENNQPVWMVKAAQIEEAAKKTGKILPGTRKRDTNFVGSIKSMAYGMGNPAKMRKAYKGMMEAVEAK